MSRKNKIKKINNNPKKNQTKRNTNNDINNPKETACELFNIRLPGWLIIEIIPTAIIRMSGIVFKYHASNIQKK